ncbi:MAG TPA: thiamine pyrophosphate-dependent dehydrogenase E1 component subunit alpha [Solirubrobacteraceae bacterium]|nr:thiamine pyrophosphate-dependent dehydrogenase E1 component subunit alpha [Solirubrobacteraceae bacterium]
MLRIRGFEQAIRELWERGLISGEMHLGIGEEAIVAGVLSQVEEGDALALDHRSTAPLVARGSDRTAIVAELLGREDGLCGGRGGHMHLFDPERLAASSGIVGASAPTACGFALAAEHLRPGSVAFAFFGEGAMNQGMVMESLNLAAAWRLPVVFVCKDSRWAITTRSRTVTAGSLDARARSFGLRVARVDGTSVDAVSRAARSAVAHARAGRGPSFILARCRRPDGHFLGDPLLRAFADPVGQTKELAPPLARALTRGPGAPRRIRILALLAIGRVIGRMGLYRLAAYRDPLNRTRRRLDDRVARACERRAAQETRASLEAALSGKDGRI